MTEPVEEEMNELYDLDVPRVDLVTKGANGLPFLIAKSAAGAGLIDADTIHQLLKSNPEAPVTATASADIEPVVKGGEDLDASTVLAEPETSAPGSETSPGSPAWEAVDAATARKWSAILTRAKNALCTLADREQVEDATGEGDLDAWSNSLDLADASCAIDYAISVLAPYAVGEQAEADLAGEGLELVGKSAAGIDTAQLEVLEALGPVLKAGRTLSAANEAAIRGAVESLQGVLSSLPAAPDDASSVTKSEEKPVTQPATATEPPAAVEPVAKAKGDPQMAVYDANGKLVGTIDQADLNPIAAPTPPDGGDKSGQDATAQAAETIPGTQTVQAPADTAAVAKSAKEQLTDVLKEAIAPLVEQLGIAELTSTVEDLKGRVEKIAAQPDDRHSPLLNGATGAGGPVHRDGPPGEDPLEPLKKAVEQAATPAEKAQAQQQLAFATIRQRFQPVR